MGLDDAIREARQRQNVVDVRRQRAEERSRQVRERLDQLSQEAVQQLAPHQHGVFYQVEEAADGPLLGQNGERYRELYRACCWVIKKMDNDTINPEVILLLATAKGTAVARARLALYVECDPHIHISPQLVNPVNPYNFMYDYSDDEAVKRWGNSDEWIDSLERDLAATIVRYESGRIGLEFAPCLMWELINDQNGVQSEIDLTHCCQYPNATAQYCDGLSVPPRATVNTAVTSAVHCASTPYEGGRISMEASSLKFMLAGEKLLTERPDPGGW